MQVRKSCSEKQVNYSLKGTFFANLDRDHQNVDKTNSFFQEQMDMKVLQFQNKKLVERIDQRKRAEEELHKRIEQLENRQRTDDAVLMIVNRYWNQVL